ncbi:MAG: hypothetical protein AB7H90_03330 [Alphaproteobacteria bacterium]
MATFKIEIECDSDAFHDHTGQFSPEPELVTVLMRYVAERLSRGETDAILKDENGNQVGFARLEDDE